MQYGSNSFSGTIHELLVFDQTLSDQQNNNVHYYLSKKWGLTATVDSDGDGFTDDDELNLYSTSPIDATDSPQVDFSDTVDAQIGESSGLDSVESNLALWLDASNIDRLDNSSIADGDAIDEWLDLSENQYHAIQETTDHQAIYSETEGGLYFEKYDDVGEDAADYYSINTNITSGTSFTIFAVEKQEDTTTNYFMGQIGTNSTSQKFHYGYRSDTVFTNAFL